jgi:glucose/mannose-6-phosphate isomerase
MSEARDSMATAIAGLANQIRFALVDTALPEKMDQSFDSIEVAAMGGSALAWDVLNETMGHQLNRTLRIHRDYSFTQVSPGALGIACSISGNTEETLAAYEMMREQCSGVIAITAGGELARRANNDSVELIRVPLENEPRDFQPRNSVGYLLTYGVRLMQTAGFGANLVSELEAAVTDYENNYEAIEDRAKQTAQWINGNIPIVYSTASLFNSLARTMKIKINENAKYAAFAGALPEINHNEMIGFQSDIGTGFRIIYLSDPSDSDAVIRRFSTMGRLFEERGFSHVQTRKIDLNGDTRAGRVLAGISFGDWCSYHLAMLRGVDPTPVDFIEAFKAELAKTGNILEAD